MLEKCIRIGPDTQPIEFCHFRSISGFIGCWKFNYQKFLLRQKIRRKISGVVSRTSFHLWLHLGGEITDLRPWASKLANKSATVKIKSSDFGISTSLSELTLKICRLNSWTTFRFNFFSVQWAMPILGISKLFSNSLRILF